MLFLADRARPILVVAGLGLPGNWTLSTFTAAEAHRDVKMNCFRGHEVEVLATQ